MADDVRTSVLLRARSPIEAQVVLALLRAEGIAAFVNGIALADEFAVSQRAMNLAGVEIEVRAVDLERARRLVEDARRAGREVGDELVEAAPEDVQGTPPPELEPMAALSASLVTALPPLPRRSRVALALGVLGWVAAGFFLYRWMGTYRDLSRLGGTRRASPWYSVTTRDGWISNWKDTGHASSEYLDANHDGEPEVTTHYVRAGWKRSVFFDANENGLSERVEEYAADGRHIGTWTDADENGVYELKAAFRADGWKTTWKDADQDGVSESSERRSPAGRLVSESQDADEDGFGVSTVHYPDGTTCLWSDSDEDGIQDRRELHDADGAPVRVQLDRGLQGFLDAKP
ncbi:MAG TPA: DUF2007 domain-containing protein [Planctomycetota bacterium]|nr:DUF2007 domain-containing protein [Planctomycetota bacterium]